MHIVKIFNTPDEMGAGALLREMQALDLCKAQRAAARPVAAFPGDGRKPAALVLECTSVVTVAKQAMWVLL